MVKFVSLNTICKDLLYIIRGSKVSQSENISEIQIENWVNQYRAILLKQDIDKGKIPNPDYIQEIPSIKLIKVDKIGRYSTITSGVDTYRTEIELPKTIDLNFKSGIMFICTLDGQEIQLLPQSRVQWKTYRKYSNREVCAYLRNGFLYVEGPLASKYIYIRGLFEIPTEVNHLVGNTTVEFPIYSNSDKYPIPINMIPVLKQMILKQELNIMLNSPSDDKNDSQLKTEPNVQQDV